MSELTMPASVFPLLADPGYWPHTVDLMGDPEARDYWIGVFENHLPSLVRHCHRIAGDEQGGPQRIEAMRQAFASQLATLRRDPAAFGELTILRICRLRENNLRAHGLADPYAPVKHEQNEAAMKLLPDVLAELDAIDPADRLEALIRGVFAGNVFDLGAVSTNTRFDEGGFDFHHTRKDIADRPWLFDDFEALARRWAGTPHRKAVVFVDNAGADLLLGMVPLCRQMLQRGTTVVLTANTLPALNDITIAELPELLDRIAGFDRTIADALADGRLSGIASGNDAPLIDLRQVSPELAEAAADADLVVLEGMGRAVETNLHAAFTCDALKLAIIKEQHLAAQLGGRLYDTVCKFEPAA